MACRSFSLKMTSTIYPNLRDNCSPFRLKISWFSQGGGGNYPEYSFSEKNTLKRNLNFDCKNMLWKIGLIWVDKNELEKRLLTVNSPPPDWRFCVRHRTLASLQFKHWCHPSPPPKKKALPQHTAAALPNFFLKILKTFLVDFCRGAIIRAIIL